MLANFRGRGGEKGGVGEREKEREGERERKRERADLHCQEILKSQLAPEFTIPNHCRDDF